MISRCTLKVISTKFSSSCQRQQPDPCLHEAALLVVKYADVWRQTTTYRCYHYAAFPSHRQTYVSHAQSVQNGRNTPRIERRSLLLERRTAIGHIGEGHFAAVVRLPSRSASVVLLRGIESIQNAHKCVAPR